MHHEHIFQFGKADSVEEGRGGFHHKMQNNHDYIFHYCESDCERGGTLDTCVTGDRPEPSLKTGSGINYHQSGDRLLEYIITNLNHTLPCTEMSLA